MQPARPHVSAPTLSVTSALPQDHAAMREVLRAAYGQYAEDLGEPFFDRYLEDLLDLDQHARAGQLVVAKYDDTVVGTAAFNPEISRQGVGWSRGWAGGRGLAVHPEARGLGVAQALVRHVERLGRDAGARVFALHTAEVMTDAVALYGRLGFERAPEFDTDLSVYFGLVDAHPVPALAFKRDLWRARPGVPGRRATVRGGTTAPAYYRGRPTWWLRNRNRTTRPGPVT